MNKIVQLIIALAMFCGGSFAGAATYYPSKDNCEAAWRAGKVENYQPTGRHKSFGDERVKGYESRSLEGDACVFLGAQPGKRWVFLKQGAMVYTKGADIKFLAECQNDIFEVVFLKKDDEPKPKVECSNCSNQTVTSVVTHVVRVETICEDQKGKRFQPDGNGECKLPPVRVTAPAPTVEQECPTCRPTAQQTRSTPRADGRCVVELQSPQGARKFVRLDKEKGTSYLLAAVVDNEQADYNRSNKLAYVGTDRQTVAMRGQDCGAAWREFTSQEVLAPTLKRLGLEFCRPVRMT